MIELLHKHVVWTGCARIHSNSCYRIMFEAGRMLCTCSSMRLTRPRSQSFFLSGAYEYGARSHAWIVLHEGAIEMISLDRDMKIESLLRIVCQET